MSILNSADLLRRHIGDRPRLAIENYYGDGTASAFGISGAPIVTGSTALGGFQPSAFVAAGNQWTATGGTFDYNLGQVTFAGVISANSAIQIKYTYGTFSDQEIDQVTATYGTYMEMQLDLIDTLMADSYKRARWASQRGAYFDDAATMTNLMMMRSAVFARLTIEQGPQGGTVGWSETQSTNG